MEVSGYSESYVWELEVTMDTHSGETTITTKKDRVLVIDLTCDLTHDLSEDLTDDGIPLVDLTLECDGTSNLTSTPCPEVIPVIDLCDDVNIIPVVDLSNDSDDDDDISNDGVSSNYTRPDWVLQEWEPRDFDSPMSPTYRCDRGLPASKFLQEWDHTYSCDRGMAGPSTPAASNFAPSSPGSPMWSPMSPENPRDRGMSYNSPTYNYDGGMAGPSSPAASNVALSSHGDSSVSSIEVGSPFYSIGSPLYIPGSPSSSSSHSDVDSGYGGMVRED